MLKAGQVKKVGPVKWDYSTLSNGTYYITAIIKNVNPTESDSTNNSTGIEYTLPCADLYVYDVDFSPGEGIAKIGHPTNITVKIKNKGKRKANSCKIGIYYGLTPQDTSANPNLSEPIGGSLLSVGPINPDDHSITPVHVQWNSDGLEAGVVYPVYVVITDANPEECDTTNNTYITSYYFQADNDSTVKDSSSVDSLSFSLISPSINDTIADTIATFTWEALPVSDSTNSSCVNYTLYIDVDSSFSNPVVIDSISTTEYTYSGLENGLTYYWKVLATDCNGNQVWSNETDWYFVVKTISQEGFSLISPAKKDTLLTLTPTFTWEAYVPFDSNSQVYYTLYYSKDSAFSDVNIIDSITQTFYVLTDSLEDSTTYYWKVKAYDNNGNEVWSRQLDWYFYILNVPYVTLELDNIDAFIGDTAVIPLKLDNISNNNIEVAALQLKLNFNPDIMSFIDALPTERISDMIISTSSDSNFISLTMFYTTLKYIEPDTGAIVNLLFAMNSEIDSLPYSADLKFASSLVSDINGSAVHSVNIDGKIFIKPLLYFSLLSPKPDSLVYAKNVEFKWEPLQGKEIIDSSYIFYTLYVDTAEDFQNPIIIDSIFSTKYILDSLTNNKYFWKVSATDCNNNNVWSLQQNWSFIFEKDTTNYTSSFALLSPEKNDTITTLTPTFQWEEFSPADTGANVVYIIYISEDSSFTEGMIIDTTDSTVYTSSQILSDSTIYYWKVKTCDNNGNEVWSTQTDWYFYTLSQKEETGITLELSDATAKPGDSVSLYLKINNLYTKLSGVELELNFDNNKLNFQNIDIIDRINENNLSISNDSNKIFITILCDSSNFIEQDTGEILKLNFVIDSSITDLRDTVNVVFISAKLTDINGAEINTATDDGIIIIESFCYGDLNNDQIIDFLDIEILSQIIKNEIIPNEYQLIVGDINQDGNIDVLDLLLLINMVYGKRDNNTNLALLKRLGINSPNLYADKFNLEQNYPNPFNSRTVIGFSLPEESQVSIIIYNLTGQVVKELVNSHFTAGYHKIVWDGRDKYGRNVPSGVYLYRIKTEKYTKNKSMILLR